METGERHVRRALAVSTRIGQARCKNRRQDMKKNPTRIKALETSKRFSEGEKLHGGRNKTQKEIRNLLILSHLQEIKGIKKRKIWGRGESTVT